MNIENHLSNNSQHITAFALVILRFKLLSFRSLNLWTHFKFVNIWNILFKWEHGTNCGLSHYFKHRLNWSTKGIKRQKEIIQTDFKVSKKISIWSEIVMDGMSHYFKHSLPYFFRFPSLFFSPIFFISYLSITNN